MGTLNVSEKTCIKFYLITSGMQPTQSSCVFRAGCSGCTGCLHWRKHYGCELRRQGITCRACYDPGGWAPPQESCVTKCPVSPTVGVGRSPALLTSALVYNHSEPLLSRPQITERANFGVELSSWHLQHERLKTGGVF